MTGFVWGFPGSRYLSRNDPSRFGWSCPVVLPEPEKAQPQQQLHTVAPRFPLHFCATSLRRAHQPCCSAVRPIEYSQLGLSPRLPQRFSIPTHRLILGTIRATFNRWLGQHYTVSFKGCGLPHLHKRKRFKITMERARRHEDEWRMQQVRR